MQKYNFMQKETWTQFVNKLTGMFGEKADKTEIPITLPNPQPITFSGVVPETTYDGSEAANIVLPSAGVNYSLEERVIGTWIDGSPLYEKAVKVVNCTQNFTHNIPDIDIGWVYTGFIDGNHGAYFNSIPYWHFPTKTTYAMINLTKTQIQLEGGGFSVDGVGYFILRYTKTTD